MSTTPTPAQITLGTYARLIGRHWKALAAGILLGVLIGTAAFLAAPKTYTARTAVLVRPTVTDGTQLAGGRTSSVLNLDTEAQILRSSLVSTRAAELLKTDEDPLNLVRNVSVSVPPNTAVLDVNFTALSPIEAQRGTKAFAQAYLENRAASAQTVVDSDVAEIQAAIDALAVQLNDLAAQLTVLPEGEPDRVYLEGERSLALQSKGRLQEQLDALIGGAISGGEILTEPRLPVNPSAPNRKLYLTGGAFLGIILGLGFALLADRRNPRVWRASEISDLHELELLAEIDLVVASTGRLERTIDTQTELSHLANVVRAAAPSHGSTTAVVGASAGEVTGWVSAGLALTLAQSGDQVTLVTAAPEPAATTAMLQVTPTVGLAHVFSGAGTIDDVRVGVDGTPSLSVVGVGARQPLAPECLNSAEMRDLVAQLDQSNMFVVLDSAAVPDSGDAQAMALLARNAIIVVELEVTTPQELAAAARTIAAVGTALTGVVAVHDIEGKSAKRWHLWRRRSRRKAAVAHVEAFPARPTARRRGRAAGSAPAIAAEPSPGFDGSGVQRSSGTDAGRRGVDRQAATRAPESARR